MHDPRDDATTDCDACPLHSRRDFLRDAAGAIASTLVLLGVAPTVAAAAPAPMVPLASPPSRGSEKRYAIPAADGVSIDAAAEVILARVGGGVMAFSLQCPHQRTALGWSAGKAEFRCPKHKSTFRPDGSLIEGRAKRAMDRLAIRRDGDAVLVDPTARIRIDQDEAAWKAAVVQVGEK